ncbi:hypothetical protein EVAR_90184_1 [Eumeta japonica]|uniref:Uncharacterized protein n=1 Tax=Eumeta variegata TaxID=151549 RepID=A0A4C1WWY7_EUMVA|nr:hypothetical protein EVAR_90184_1 [Eumeta japonica]
MRGTLEVSPVGRGRGATQVGTGRRSYFSPQARASSRRGYDPDGSSGNGYINHCFEIMPAPSPHHPPTLASSRMHSIAGGGAPDCEEVVVEGGREAQNRLHTQPTAGGRTLVDADRIKAARIGDPLGVDPTERACRPLIRLSTHSPAAARALRLSRAGGRRRTGCTQPTAGGRTLVDADRIKAARIGDPLGVDLTERACRPLIRLSTHSPAAARALRVS